VGEEDLRRADHVDDKRLGPERFHEPARVKNSQHEQESQSIIRFQRNASHRKAMKHIPCVKHHFSASY